MKPEQYQKYRWFFTRSDKLVIGGKSAQQNDDLLKELKSSGRDHVVLHTTAPGSPFTVILGNIKSIKKQDIKEAAIFTASFSKAWKQMKKKSSIEVFHLSNLYKLATMKTGTWGVKNKIDKISAPLELVLVKQKNKLRAIPEITVKSKKSILLKLVPGNTDKQRMIPKLTVLLPPNLSEEEILKALPPGGIKIIS